MISGLSTTAPAQLTQNSAYTFILNATKNNGSIYDLTGLSVSLKFFRPDGATDVVAASSVGPGFANATYTPTLTGTYSRAWYISNVPITSLPFPFMVVASPG
jgi:hypothetical protein